jgi:hypothetical protein
MQIQNQFPNQQIIYHLERSLKASAHPKQLSQPCWRTIAESVKSNWSAALWRLPEPQIHQYCDRTGTMIWRVYNPRTGQSAHCLSEEDAIAWLDR